MSNGKQRHGCLTAWLIFMIIVNALGSLVYLFAGNTLAQALPNAPGWIVPVLTIVCLFNVICAVALWKWKKWGFYGFIASSVAALIINLSIGVSIFQSLVGLLSIAILYGILQIGTDNKGWPQLD